MTLAASRDPVTGDHIKIPANKQTFDVVQGTRFNQGKPKLSFILTMPNAMSGVSKVMEFGARKYAKNNWKKGLSHTEIVDSMQRHLTAYMSGELVDQESGLQHIDHIACNAMFLAEMIHIHPELDDREVDDAQR